MDSDQDTLSMEVPLAPCIAEPLDPALQAELLTDVDELGQVTVHCSLTTGWADFIRIWPTTYLVCRHSAHRSPLIHAEGIPYAPVWQSIGPGRTVTFTLLFAPLPNSCVLFDLVEEIPEEGGFFCGAILRNGMDVYRVEV